MESRSLRQARRLALARGGLLQPGLTELPDRAAGKGRRARARCHGIIDRFGYLQLDSVSVAGARTHAIVLASRLKNFDASLGEELLAPGEPLFEYWGHEACWMPLSMYPYFEFRRRQFRVHPWWGDLLGEHPRMVREIMRRVEQEGPFRSADLDGDSGPGWWDLKLSKRIAEALWSAGDLAIAKRHRFHRTFDLTERVIPESVRRRTGPRRMPGRTAPQSVAGTWRGDHRNHGGYLAAEQLPGVDRRIAAAARGRRTNSTMQPGGRRAKNSRMGTAGRSGTGGGARICETTP